MPPSAPPKPSARPLPLAGESAPLVLATVETARQLLPGHDEDDILSLCDEGFICFAWNISLTGTEDTARELRLWPECITHYQTTGGSRPYPRTIDQVVGQILMSNKPYIPGTSLRLLLNCSSTHIINLVESKQLALQPDTDYKRGPNGSPLITIPSLKQFLTRRLL